MNDKVKMARDILIERTMARAKIQRERMEIMSDEELQEIIDDSQENI